jgi:hypothetical protein
VSNDGGTMKSVPIPPALDQVLEVAPFADANAETNEGSVA